MSDKNEIRCIGESPPVFGARYAYAYVPPNHEGPCVLHFELNGVKRHAKFPNYAQARSAAIRAIFSPGDDLQAMQVRSVSPETEQSPRFKNSTEWFATINVMPNDGRKTVEQRTAECA
jgi:hypothetical protein